MRDWCETLGRSEIQHGPFSNRIYLMKLDRRDLPEIVGRLNELARRRGYSKIFAKIPAGAAPAFTSAGYRREAVIPDFYQGREAAVFLGKYLDRSRAVPGNSRELDSVLALARARSGDDPGEFVLPSGLSLLRCASEYAEAMSRVYREVFPSYPFPIHDPEYLRETMRTHVEYFGVRREGELIALASSELDFQGRSVEMTDFATLPAHRGLGLGTVLLQEMERAMIGRGMLTSYTIARAVSPGMNITFARLGYRYGGTLVNNTQISGGIESMNIWYKSLQVASGE